MGVSVKNVGSIGFQQRQITIQEIVQLPTKRVDEVDIIIEETIDAEIDTEEIQSEDDVEFGKLLHMADDLAR